MANKRNHLRRNKKSNKWKASIKKSRATNRRSDEDAVSQSEKPCNALDQPDIPAVAEELASDGEERNTSDSITVDYANDSTTNIIDFQLNYYNVLSSDDEEQNTNDSTTNENDSMANTNDFETGGSVSDLTEDDDSSSDGEANLENRKVSGRRIFEIADLFEQMRRIGNHSKNCSFGDMVVISEVKRGLNSIFKFQCEKCGVLRKLESCPKKVNSLTCNEEAVLGINSVGSGFYHLEEFLSQLSVPCMGNSTYDKISKNQQTDWWNLAKKNALEALKEEIELAKSANEIDSLGRALIAVICDGSWGKRSYGKKFNSLSGCAVLIGVRTKKVVFFGVRNKYCHKCKIAQSKCTPVNYHICNINYTGPSSGMEADIILEGFKSCEEHGARFHKLIADGDSSTYKTLRDFRVYQNPDLFIEKLECVNHLFRNFRTKFSFLSKVTKFDSDLRKHVNPSKGQDICKGIKVASTYWRESNVGLTEKIDNLENDIMNAPSHYFGVHTNCNSYFCKKATTQAAIDNLNLLKEDGLYYEIQNLCQTYFAGNAKSLLENHTNNAAEEFNNLVAKNLGGKRINYSLAGSYTARVASAVVQYNSGGHSASEFRKFKLGDNLRSSTTALENKRKRKLVANEAARDVKPRNRHPKEETTDVSYLHGDGSEDVDMSPSKFERCKDAFLKKLEERQKNRKSIERRTIHKKHNSYWQVIRRDLLPSSYFHRIIKAIRRNSYTKILEEIMYTRSEFGNGAQIKHQRLVQRDALNWFKNQYKDHSLEECGFFIDKELSYLGASPLRLYGNDHILSIKCPLKEYNKNFEDVIAKIPFWKKVDGNWQINTKSDWYIELQGEMRVTGKKYSYLLVWLGESKYKIEKVAKNDTFFDIEMKEKLTYFYMEVMLKELVDPRKRKNMELRKYNDETGSFTI